jgi:hypothetical protein
MNFGLQNWLSGAGDIALQHQKIKPNQLGGSNSLRECMAWEGRIHLGMQEHVSPGIPNFCNKK